SHQHDLGYSREFGIRRGLHPLSRFSELAKYTLLCRRTCIQYLCVRDKPRREPHTFRGRHHTVRNRRTDRNEASDYGRRDLVAEAGDRLSPVGWSLGLTTGIVTILLVNTFCAMNTCVSGLVG